MKIQITYFAFLFFSVGYAQQKPIERFVLPARDLDHNGCINNIRVKSYHYYENKKQPDTIYREYLAIFNEDKVSKRLSFSQNNPEPTQEIFYDNLGRVTKLKRKNYGNKKFLITQHYNNNSQYPDSTNFYFDDIKNEAYINTFSKDTLITRQEHFMRDTLRTYTKFEYDNSNRLIEQIKVNTKNGFGITIGKSITGTKDEKSLYPNDSILYIYRTIGDSLIKTKIKDQELAEKEITIKNDTTKTEIFENYGWGYLRSKKITRKYQDSTNIKQYYFDRNKDTTTIVFEIRTSDLIFSKWIGKNSSSDNKILIRTINDSRGNWIKKEKINNGVLEDEIFREINYCR